MKVAGILLTCLFVLTGEVPVDSQAKKASQMGKIMAAKLENAKQLLEGIALSDFRKVTRAAEELDSLSRRAEWQAVNTPRYEMHSNEFRRALEGLIAKAKDKNLDGVTLSYFEVTMSCVRCHKYVREMGIGLPPASATGLVNHSAISQGRSMP